MAWGVYTSYLGIWTAFGVDCGSSNHVMARARNHE